MLTVTVCESCGAVFQLQIKTRDVSGSARMQPLNRQSMLKRFAQGVLAGGLGQLCKANLGSACF